MASYLYGKIRFENCPFCGQNNFRFDVGTNGKITKADELDDSTNAEISCKKCGVKMLVWSESEHYEHVEGDMYRKIPFKAAIYVLADRWNKRVPVTDEYEV